MPPFPQGWGDAFEWFGSIAAIWRTQLQQPPKKYRRLPVALNRVRSRDTTSSETCSLLIVDSAGRCLGTVNSFFFFPGASWMADDVFGEIRILGS